MSLSTILHSLRPLLLAGVTAALLTSASHAVDWPQFRGPASTGVGGAPAPGPKLAEAWKVDLPGRGLSSPVIVGSKLFLTASSGPRQETLHVLCFDTATGKRQWERTFRATGRTMCHDKTCVAAPTVCSDGSRVFALFSSNDLFALDLDGNLLWLRGLTVDYANASNSLGMASSPIFVGGTLIVPSENDSESLTAGLDPLTGVNRWKMDRPKAANWTSPIPLGDKAVLQSSKGLTCVDPMTGSVLWNYGDGASTIPSSVASQGVIYAPSHGLTALKPPGTGGEPQQLWRSEQINPSTGSPLVLEGKVYTLNSAGVLLQADATTGDRAWKLRLEGPFSGSPVAAGKWIYVVNEKGLVQVVDSTAAEGEVAGKLALGETVLCTPSLADGALFVRSDAHLWRLK